jgi:REP element-mobilizing transposase RayT
MVFHVLNRGVGRRNLFDKDSDFLAFERVLLETLRVRPMRVCAWCLMSNHWHFVLWPEKDGDLAAFMQQLTNTHVKRWKKLASVIFIRGATSRSRSSRTNTSTPSSVTSNATRYAPIWSQLRSAGHGPASAVRAVPTTRARPSQTGLCVFRTIGSSG